MFQTRSDNSRTTVGKHTSGLSELDSAFQNNDYRKTYHANFSKRVATESDTESAVTDNRIEYHRVDVVGEGLISVVHKAVNLRNGK